jgi:hypothetical protein
MGGAGWEALTLAGGTAGSGAQTLEQFSAVQNEGIVTGAAAGVALGFAGKALGWVGKGIAKVMPETAEAASFGARLVKDKVSGVAQNLVNRVSGQHAAERAAVIAEARERIRLAVGEEFRERAAEREISAAMRIFEDELRVAHALGSPAGLPQETAAFGETGLANTFLSETRINPFGPASTPRLPPGQLGVLDHPPRWTSWANPRERRPWATHGRHLETVDEWIANRGYRSFLDPSVREAERVRRQELLREWAQRAGVDPARVEYRDPLSLGSGGAALFPSGQIVLSPDAWGYLPFAEAERWFLAPDVRALVRFAHEVGHWRLRHNLRFSGAGLEAPNWAERAASRVGAEVFPEVRELMLQHAESLSWRTLRR